MGRIAFVFPGQGSQAPGMGRELFEQLPAAREAFAEMDAALESPVSRLCFEGSEEELRLTENTQPAILATSVAAWRCLDARGLRPDYVAGHSLGEWSALVAAGVLSARDAVSAVRKRGRYMQEAVPVGEGAMAALLGIDRAAVDALCERTRREGEVLSAANYNSGSQVVVAGSTAAVARALEAAAEAGARRSVLLPVSAPFHCALMEPAARRLAADLSTVRFLPFRIPLVANIDARENSDPDAARAALVAQVTAPVLWEDSVQRLVALGVDAFIEVGPGQVLSGLIKRIAPKGARILSASTPQEIEVAVSALAPS